MGRWEVPLEGGIRSVVGGVVQTGSWRGRGARECGV
jgi:hypothetical protein